MNAVLRSFFVFPLSLSFIGCFLPFVDLFIRLVLRDESLARQKDR
jgi:thiol:disulfide interchange protein